MTTTGRLADHLLAASVPVTCLKCQRALEEIL
ncbi:hypothetical protein HDA36_001465 [Nocardiopsis composta]|uniref:Uncharacterized protein n=1 Tax=Nocardiopsis composta TaxID=157465 RepID=A0A7W8VCF5_9ACTN|nr:hypothetical protein [Nocardiopsis composta]